MENSGKIYWNLWKVENFFKKCKKNDNFFLKFENWKNLYKFLIFFTA